MSEETSVLFARVHNAGRSRTAAGFLTAIAGDAVEVRSAGSIDISAARPKALIERRVRVLLDERGVPA